MNRLLCFIFTLLAAAPRVSAQENFRTTLFGVGRTSQYDTYLSPLAYKGPSAALLHNTQRPLVRNQNVLFHTITHLDFSHTRNPAHTAYYVGGDFRFDAGWHYRWGQLLPHLQLKAGLQAGTSVGFLYNNRNSNNPAQARACAELSASVGGSYNLRIKKRTLTFRYQVDFPFLGAMFSPRFGQSYYNLFYQHNYDHNVLLTHPANALSLRQFLSLSLPLRKRSLTVGYLSDLRQATPHHLRQHRYARCLVIGWTLGRKR